MVPIGYHRRHYTEKEKEISILDKEFQFRSTYLPLSGTENRECCRPTGGGLSGLDDAGRL